MNKPNFLQRLLKNRTAAAGLCFLTLLLILAVTANLFISEDMVIGQDISQRLQKPSWQHPFGTDETGREMLWRVLYGSRYSLLIGFASALLSLLIGVTLGAVSGYFGGIAGQLIMRLTDVFSALPSVLTAMAVTALLGGSEANLILAVGISAVPLFVRISRAAVMESYAEAYTEAARCMGAGPWRILVTHTLPHIFPTVLIQFCLRVGSAILAASSLSFLGLGLGAPIPEWGALLAAGRGFIRSSGYLSLFPGIFITLTVLAFQLLGDGLRDVLDVEKSA